MEYFTEQVFFINKVKEPLTIFLDVDGVLNKESDWINPFALNDSCIKIFNELWQELSKHYIPQLVLINTQNNVEERNQ